jgi:predicted amidophosphoribosyltransferase
MSEDDIEKIVNEVLRVTAATHKRRRCIAHGVRSVGDIRCDCHRHWNHARKWCDNCGRTLKDHMAGSEVEQ